MYIFLFQVEELYYKLITMTRKSGEHLHTTYENTVQLFRPYKVSSAVYTVISTTRDRISNHRMQSRNSTTEPPTHITHKWCQIKSSHGNCMAN